MKTMKNLFALCLAGAACAMAPAAWAQTGAEAQDLLFLKQEEKLARDVYQALAARWNHTVFQNISRSEQSHMNAVDLLIKRYGLKDATPAGPGMFTYPELQALYDQLMASGSQSLENALAAGVVIEETDLASLDQILKETSQLAIRRVADNLRAASQKHLSAFNFALQQLAAAGTAVTGTCVAGCVQTPPLAPAKTQQRERR